jgi:acyl-CoA reductase-like NAD-dependent aldehyde dehydrogenase
MRRAADRLIPVSLELGGKDPMIVLKDADMERAAGACVWGALMNCGQTCTSIERVYVEAPIYQAFVDNVTARVKAIRQGTSAEAVDIGAMTSAAQPTVLVDVDHSMSIMADETFGPVIPIMQVDSPEEAVRLANDSRYGLSASIYSRDRSAALKLADQLDSGAVCVNDSLVNFIIPEAPMGGRKDSGFGYRHGAAGIRKFCQEKTIVVDRFGLKEEFPWYPASEKKARQVRHLLNLLCHSGWSHKLRALKGLIRS